MKNIQSNGSGRHRHPVNVLVAFNAIGAAVGWSYATTFAQIAHRWLDTPEYSHGWLIPAFSLWLIWSNLGGQRSFWTPTGIAGLAMMALGLYLSHDFGGTPIPPSVGAVLAGCGCATCLAGWLSPPERGGAWLLGGLVLLGAIAFRIASVYFFMEWFDQLSLIPLLAGLALIVFGVSAPRGLYAAIGFLTLMIPLPFTLEGALRDPLRSVATKLSAYTLQTMGFPAITEGYVIVVGEMRIGVVEACSGLRMLTVFAALTIGLVLMTRRPWWYQTVLCLSWPAIAVLANVFRIVLTGALHFWGFDSLADIAFHDLAGLAMMPVGLALLWLEMAYLDHLLVMEVERPISPLFGGVEANPQQVAAR